VLTMYEKAGYWNSFVFSRIHNHYVLSVSKHEKMQSSPMVSLLFQAISCSINETRLLFRGERIYSII
jgi:hypothetical protein